MPVAKKSAWAAKAQAAQKSLSKEDEGESSEDDEQADEVLKRLLNHYTETPGLNDDLNMNLERVSEAIKASGKGSGAQICLVCLETVGRTEPIWNCGSCFEMYHLVCIQQWSSQALQLCQLREEENIVWCCPKCRKEYTKKEQPSRYFCFCGKAQDPRPDPWTAPHSCGEGCGKQLECEHRCLLLCHPGPCPACPKVIHAKCFCGKKPAVPRRCGQKGWSCGNACGRLLNCGLHRCQTECHDGPCAPCESSSLRACRCGRKKAERRCVEGQWDCGQICGKILEPCRKHKCQQICHSGPCRTCVAPGENTCPCGKHTYEESGCIEALPCCGDTCGKLLDCGFHNCFQRCHRGECPSCKQTRVKRCRCGGKERDVQCNKEYLCDVKCRKKRQCGRHPCSRKCCDGRSCPPCEAVCGRSLNCGRHKCPSPCHPGMCYPCPEIVEVKCRCGQTKIRVPCGRDKKTRPPRCRLDCSVPPDCHHPARERHRCHFGMCPPCKLICGKAHPSKCGHLCPVSCHSAVWMDTNSPSAAPATPWEKPTPRMDFVSLDCPPCMAMVTVQCKGYHESTDFPCCEVRQYSCGRECNRPLACGNHKCKLECHEVPQDPNSRGKDCEECNSMCDLPRPDGCPHTCPRPCHPSPCPPCRQMIKQLCHCGLNQKYVPCKEWTSVSADERENFLGCGNQCPKEMNCGHRCTKLCHRGPCSSPMDCKKKKPVSCECGERSVRIQCKAAQEGEKPECTGECDEKRKRRAEEVKAKRESEDQSGQEAPSRQESYDENAPRRIRKKKQRKEMAEEGGGWGKKAVIPAVAVMVALIAWLLYGMLN